MEIELNAIVNGVINLHPVLREGNFNHESPEGECPNPFLRQRCGLAYISREDADLPSMAKIYVKFLTINPPLFEMGARTIITSPILGVWSRVHANRHRVCRVRRKVERLPVHSRRRLPLEVSPFRRIVRVPMVRQTWMRLVHRTRVRSCEHNA